MQQSWVRSRAENTVEAKQCCEKLDPNIWLYTVYWKKYFAITKLPMNVWTAVARVRSNNTSDWLNKMPWKYGLYIGRQIKVPWYGLVAPTYTLMNSTVQTLSQKSADSPLPEKCATVRHSGVRYPAIDRSTRLVGYVSSVIMTPPPTHSLPVAGWVK